MVKKTTFLEKLFGARKEKEGGIESVSGSGRTGEGPGTRDWGIGGGGEEIPVRPRPGSPELSETAGNDSGNGKEESTSLLKRGRKEEAMVALTEGFKDLSELLTGIRDRMEEQGRRAGDLNEKVADLPTLAKAQVDFMTAISKTLEQQNRKTGELVQRLGNLPDLLEGIHKTLEKQVAAEERSEKTMQDFRSTMDRIHSSIGKLSKENSDAVKEATTSLERTHERTTRVFEKTQTQAYAAFEKAQKAHLAQLKSLMERSARMNRTIVVLLAIVFAGLAALFAIVLVGPGS